MCIMRWAAQGTGVGDPDSAFRPLKICISYSFFLIFFTVLPYPAQLPIFPSESENSLRMMEASITKT